MRPFTVVLYFTFGPLRSAEIFGESRKYNRFRLLYSKQIFAIQTAFRFRLTVLLYPCKLCLWEGILFSRCPTDRVSVMFCFLNNLCP